MSRTPEVPNLPIAVVGVGCRFPEAADADGFWRIIEDGRVTFREVPPERWNHEVFYSANQRDVDKAWVASGSFIQEFREFAAMHYGISPRRLEVMDPQQRLLIEATRWALQDAGYERRGFERRRTGVFFGVSVSEFKNIAQARVHAMQLAGGDFGRPAGDPALRDALVEMASHVVPMRAFHISGSLTALAAATVSQTFDLGGPAYVIDSACASASVAVSDAMLHLRSGKLDFAVAGGAYLNLSPDNLVAFTKIGAISPTGMCRPFDHRADGFVQSDGVGVLMLRRLDDALRDGDRVHAVLIGSGCNNDGRGEGPMTPRYEGQLEVLRSAYADAEVSPASVSYFEAHGTATSVGDPVEVGALGTLLQEAGRTEPALIGSVKGNIGHAMSAAGIAGLVKAIKVLDNRTAPPQPGFEQVNPKLGLERFPLQVSTERKALDTGSSPLRVAVSSFGFGGTNSHLVLEAPPVVERKPAVSEAIEVSLDGAGTEAPEPEALVVTAPTPELLAKHLTELERFLSEGPGRRASLADLAFTLNARRDRERYRAVIGARSISELFRNLSAVRAALHGSPSFPLQVSPHAAVHDAEPDGKPAAPKVAYLFPGQGAQSLGLLEGVRRRFPVFDEALERFSAATSDLLEAPLSSYLYPEQRDDAAAARLTATEVCQPAMTALSLALGKLLDQVGVRPQVALGHSLGEFGALAHAGVMSAEDAVRLVAERGRAMATLPLEDSGAMAAVMADAATVQARIADVAGVVVANVNHPKQVSISGTSAGVEAARAKLEAAGFDVRPLEVSHAFHSPVLDGIDARMAEILGERELGSPRHLVASCIESEVYTADAQRTRGVLTKHGTSPVQFVRGLEQCRDAGADVFVQVGAGKTLLSFTRATLGRSVPTLTLAPTTDDRGYELVLGLATLSALGVEVDFDALYAGEQRQVVTLPETPLVRENYWVIKDRPQPTAELTHPVADSASNPVVLAAPPVTDAGVAAPAEAKSELVALFEKQADILRTHAEILAAQTRALTGGAPIELAELPTTLPAPKPEVEASPAEPAPAARTELPEPAEPEEAAGSSADDVREKVFEIISKVSAFPKANLREDQRLVDELGFDSLMVADLGGAIESSFPSAGGLPPDLFSLETTVADISRHLVEKVATGAPKRRAASVAPRAAEATARAPSTTARVEKAVAQRYRVLPRPLDRLEGALHEVRGETWLVTQDDSRFAQELAQGLTQRGARVVQVRFTQDGVSTPTTLAFGTVNLWPESFVEGLPEAIEQAKIELDGFLHVAGSSSDGFAHPLRLLHPLVAALDPARIGVITSLGGKLGLERGPSLSKRLLQSAALGYTKALARERPSRVVRAVDVDPRVDAARNAVWTLDELLSADRAPEVGFTGGQRMVAELEPVASSSGGRRIGPQDVVLVTGGAGEIGFRVAEWAASQGPKGIILAGRRPIDDAINEQLAKLRSHGCTAVYLSVDVAEPDALAQTHRLFVDRVGQVSVVFHAAGVIEDKPATKKSMAEVERVLSVKVRGAQAILQAFPELKDLVLFSSWAGRFGNAGQVDYAAANEVLDRLAVASSNSTRTLSIDWPPWAGTKMVDSIPPALKAAMEKQGVTFLEPEEGIALLAEAFEQGSRGAELVGRNMPARSVSVRVHESFDLSRHPYLEDHRLNGRPVVPLASVADWMGRVARQAVGGKGALVIESMQLTRGVMGDEVAELKLEGRVGTDGNAELEAEVRAGKDRVLAYRAKIRVEADQSRLARFELAGSPKTAPLTLDEFYADHTFHGPLLRGIKRLHRSTEQGISGTVLAADPAKWRPKAQGSDVAWAADPRVVDGSFQLAGYWLHVHEGRAGFPTGFERLTLLRPFGKEPVHATVRLRDIRKATFTGDICYADVEGELYAVLEGVSGRFADLDSASELEAKTNGVEVNGHAKAEIEPVVEVPSESYDIAQFPEVEALEQRLQMATLMGLENPYFAVHEGTARDTSVIGGKEMVHYSGYNYLGFSGRKEVVQAAQDAAAKYGTSVSASRIASGERPLHQEFEKGIADHLGVDDAILYVGGHATNVTTIGHILGKEDLVLHDALIHDSIFQGIKLSGAQRRPYAHEDMDALERMLQQVRGSFRRVLICAEGIYSMDGDICNLPRLVELKKKYRCLLLVDEAHSIGVLGPQGRGVGHHFEGIEPRDVDMWMGTLSKSFASVGGYIAGSSALIKYLKYTAPGFVYSVGLAPPNTAAALASLHLMQAEPETVERLRDNSRYFLDVCQKEGLDTGPAVGAAVIPVIVGDSVQCVKLSARLKERGINVQPIVYPAVENEAARLRFFISALHTREQLDFTAATVREELQALRAAEDGPRASL